MTRLLAKAFLGLDVRTPREKLRPELFQNDVNGDRRRRRAWRVRNGYSRFMSGNPVPVFTADYSDDFNRGTQTDLGVNWSYYGCVGPTKIRVVSNEVQSGIGFGTLMGAEYNAGSFAADQASEITVVNVGNAADSTPGVGVRLTSFGGYYMMVDGNNTTLRLYAITDWGDCGYGTAAVVILDTFTTIGNGSYGILAWGSTMRLHVNGSTLRGYVNDTKLLQATSVLHGAGRPGLLYSGGAITSTPWRIDDWGGGVSVLGVENVKAPGKPTRLTSFERSDETMKIACLFEGAGYDGVEEFNTGAPE